MTISKIKLVKLTNDKVMVIKTDGTIWGTKSVTELSNILTHNLEKQFSVLHNDYVGFHDNRALKLWNNALKKAKLSDTMDSVPPIVDFDTPANVLVPLIRYSKCILVSKKSKIVGIITASDTLKMMEG